MNARFYMTSLILLLFLSLTAGAVLHARDDKPKRPKKLYADGTYQAQSLGYSAEIIVRVTVKTGRIDQVRVHHQETLDLGASTYLPRRMVDLQTPDVDAFSGATVTSEAIVEAANKALKQAEEKAKRR